MFGAVVTLEFASLQGAPVTEDVDNEDNEDQLEQHEENLNLSST